MRVEWRFAMVVPGAQSAMTTGHSMTLPLPANNLTSLEVVKNLW